MLIDFNFPGEFVDRSIGQRSGYLKTKQNSYRTELQVQDLLLEAHRAWLPEVKE